MSTVKKMVEHDGEHSTSREPADASVEGRGWVTLHVDVEPWLLLALTREPIPVPAARNEEIQRAWGSDL